MGAAGLRRCIADAAVGPPDRPGVSDKKNATGAKVGDRLPGANPEGEAVVIGFIAEVREAGGGVGQWKDEGLLGED